MTQRILFHPAPTVEWLKGLQVETLGKIPKGTWLAADDAAALELLKRDKSTLMLYPTQAEYLEAIEGLDETEKAKAVALRQEILDYDPRAFSLPVYSERSLGILSAAASGSNEAGMDGQAMRAMFRKQLDLTVLFAGGEQAGGSGVVPLLDGIYDPLNELNWEEEVLRKHVGNALPPLDPALQGSRQALTLEIQRAMKRNGALYEQEPTGKSLPSLERGVFATPLDPILVKGIRSSHEPVLEWKDGFVCLWNESQFDQVPMKGKKKRILYFNAKVFQAENTGLTPGQIRASLEKRSKRPLEEDAREYLADLKLDATLALLRRGKAVARTEKALGEAMARHAELEIESLRALLAEYAIWRKAKTSTLDQVKSEAAAMIPELEFWNAWVSRKMWALQQEQLEGYLAALRKP